MAYIGPMLAGASQPRHASQPATAANATEGTYTRRGPAGPVSLVAPPPCGASVKRGTENLMHGLHEQLAVLVRQAAQVDQETRRAT